MAKNLNKPYKYAVLLAMINAILGEDVENRINYGAARVYIRAKQEPHGYTGSYSTVYRVMKTNGLLQKKKHYPKGITKEDQSAEKSQNLLKQDFTSDTPNTKWLTDITEIPTADGKLYVAPVFDCFDGAIVGLSMDDNMRKELCISAFEQACRHYNANGMILHSDRGS